MLCHSLMIGMFIGERQSLWIIHLGLPEAHEWVTSVTKGNDFWTIFDKTFHSAVDRATHVKGHKAKLALLRSDRHSIERSMPLATAENLLHTHSCQNFKILSKNYDTIFKDQNHRKSDLNTQATFAQALFQPFSKTMDDWFRPVKSYFKWRKDPYFWGEIWKLWP